ncbi:MAG: hypothetical protein GF364_14675, partial [Candidatus Lokiarchaeota archaeon]|nr:hypothetical protein [Candidatus Lokiarchaeota archaeon]
MTLNSYILFYPNYVDYLNLENTPETLENENQTKLSTPDFLGATKTITTGSQVDPPFVSNNILFNDGIVDDTMFCPGWGAPKLKDVADYGVVSYTGAFGSTDAGLWYFTNAYKDNDNKYLYVDSTWGNDYPGWIHMKWGAYSNIEAGSHAHVKQIRFDYEVWADSFAGVLDHSTNLRLYVYDDQGHVQYHTIASNPVHRHKYISTFYLTSGSVLDRVRAGGYIKYLAVYMYANEELWTHTWINVDYVDILYDFHNPDVDYFYELDYEGYGFTTITQFQVEIDLAETLSGTDVHIYDYDSSTWDEVLSVDSAGVYYKNINTDADHYFSQSNKIRIRIERYNYWDGRLYNQYHIKVDYVKINIPPPDPPPNMNIEQNILHVFLTWDPPTSYGVPISHYNIYRGTTQGGIKSLLDTSITTEYNDTSAIVGTYYYYTVSAVTASGEGDNSTEVSGRSYDQPFVSWTSPNENASIVFPQGDPVTFHFEYDWGELDDVELIIEKGAFSFNHGSVWNKTSIDIFEASYLDGYINATLNGFNKSVLVASDTRHFTFVKIIFEVASIVNSSTEILGKQLYLILHDPHGDNSYSSYTQSTQLSMGVGMELASSVGVSLEIGDDFSLFGVELGASMLLEYKATVETGFDFRYEITDTNSLTSSQVTDDADYIGPGLGDRYWGESWILKWVLNATYRVYSNGTARNEDPQLFYGILRDVETFCSDEHAPDNWKQQNVFYNDSIPVTWLGIDQKSGGAPFEFEHEVSTTSIRKIAVGIELGSEFRAKFPGGESAISLEMSMKNYVESGVSSTHSVGYQLYDDDPTDFIVQGVGIDHRFGTYIFNSSSFFCETCQPLEHNTYDYMPPEIDFPECELDSDGDNVAPTPNDSPVVCIDIFEEGGISEAIIWYSIDNGSSWDIAYLSELSGQLGTWEGSIPKQSLNTTVFWYVQAWDVTGNNNSRFNSYSEPFEYTVIA